MLSLSGAPAQGMGTELPGPVLATQQGFQNEERSFFTIIIVYWGNTALHPHQRSELWRRLWVQLTHTCHQFHQSGLGTGPSPAPDVDLERVLATQGSSRWECPLGPEPGGKGTGLLETDTPISLPTCSHTPSADPMTTPLVGLVTKSVAMDTGGATGSPYSRKEDGD